MWRASLDGPLELGEELLLGVSAEPQKSPGRIGGTLKVCLKLEMASDSQGADRRPRRINGNLLVQKKEVHLARSREAFRFLCPLSMIPLDSRW